MYKWLLSIAVITGFFAVVVGIPATAEETAKFIYDFKMKNIDGKEVNLSDYKGKVLVVVNVASKCGRTPQYKDLQAMYSEYKEKGLVVMGFPANEFGKQEPGTNAEIKEFCALNYKVSFPMFSKIVVKGEGIHPLYKYLTSLENSDFKGEISWNFEKFLFGKDGKLLRRFKSKESPSSDEFKAAVKKALQS